MKTYSELIRISSFEDRINYLKIYGSVGQDTFGFDRYLNQNFYHSREWKQLRDHIIVRDNGCDLAHQDYPISGKILIHHINPIVSEDIVESSDFLLNPEYLVCVSLDTHNLIHYGVQNHSVPNQTERFKGDTLLWKKQNT